VFNANSPNAFTTSYSSCTVLLASLDGTAVATSDLSAGSVILVLVLVLVELICLRHQGLLKSGTMGIIYLLTKSASKGIQNKTIFVLLFLLKFDPKSIRVFDRTSTWTITNLSLPGSRCVDSFLTFFHFCFTKVRGFILDLFSFLFHNTQSIINYYNMNVLNISRS